MNFWCSTQSGIWTWAWQPYVGVWMMVAVLMWLHVRWHRRWRGGLERRRLWLYSAGVLALWIAADWPIGPLGATYLLSAHTLQYLLFAMVAPPLLLAGTHPMVLRHVIDRPLVHRLARICARPMTAFLVFNGVLLASHLPGVVDTLTRSQLGSFAVNMAWLFSGLLFWWQVQAPLEEFRPLGYPGRMLFLLLNVFIPTVPAAFLTYARYPIYSLYELAPPVWSLTATEDQQLAGVLMKVVGGFIMFGAATVLFFKWKGQEESEPASIHRLAEP